MVDLETLRFYNSKTDRQYSCYDYLADINTIFPNYIKESPNELVFTNKIFHKKGKVILVNACGYGCEIPELLTSDSKIYGLEQLLSKLHNITISVSLEAENCKISLEGTVTVKNDVVLLQNINLIDTLKHLNNQEVDITITYS